MRVHIGSEFIDVLETNLQALFGYDFSDCGYEKYALNLSRDVLKLINSFGYSEIASGFDGKETSLEDMDNEVDASDKIESNIAEKVSDNVSIDVAKEDSSIVFENKETLNSLVSHCEYNIVYINNALDFIEGYSTGFIDTVDISKMKVSESKCTDLINGVSECVQYYNKLVKMTNISTTPNNAFDNLLSLINSL